MAGRKHKSWKEAPSGGPQIVVSDGYEVFWESRTYCYEDLAMESMERIRSCTEAYPHEDGTVTLVWESCSCPFCGNRFPRNSWNPADGLDPLPDFLERNMATSLTPGNSAPFIRKKCTGDIPSKGAIQCPFCGAVLRPALNPFLCSITSSDDKAMLIIHAEGGAEIERLIFRFDNGKTVRAKPGKHGVILNRMPSPQRGDRIINTVLKSSAVQKALEAAFVPVFPCGFPKGRKIILDQLVLYTQFQGYTEAFYNCVPLDEDQILLRHYEFLGSPLRNCNALPSVLTKMGLPKAKSFRRVLIERPFLLFYLMMIRNLPMSNIDLLVRFLRMEHCEVILKYWYWNSFGLYRYLRTCYQHSASKTSGEGEDYYIWRALLKEKNWLWLIRCSEAYCDCMVQSDERSDWEDMKKILDGDRETVERRVGLYISIGRLLSEQNHPACDSLEGDYDGFSFRLLRTEAQYRAAGRQLRNCLTTYRNPSADIGCVYREGIPVAAWEVALGKYLDQAFLKKNKPIRENPEVYAAFQKWAADRNLYADQFLHIPNGVERDETAHGWPG